MTSTITMGNEHGVVVLPTFRVDLYMLLISYLALALVPFTDLLCMLN
jgi:hypothetical protein